MTKKEHIDQSFAKGGRCICIHGLKPLSKTELKEIQKDYAVRNQPFGYLEFTKINSQ